MRTARLVTWLLILAAVLVDAAVLSTVNRAVRPFVYWPAPILTLPFSLCFAQVSLVATWSLLGRAPVPWRIVGLVSTVTLWSLALTAAMKETLTRFGTDEYGTNDWTVLLMTQVVLLVPALVAVRWTGWRLVDVAGGHAVEKRRRLQFTLGYLFAWMTAGAVTLGMLKYTIDYEILVKDDYDLKAVLTVGFVNAAIGLVLGWVVLGRQSRLLWVFAACAAVAALAYGYHVLQRTPGPYARALLLLWLLEVAWLSSSLGVLCAGGIRIARHEEETQRQK